MVRTLALSDLHLGRVTTCAHAPEIIAPLVEGFDRVLLLGDIIDHWYTEPDQAQQLEIRIKAVCKKAGVREVVYFRGNHDACIAEGEEFALLDGILYLHGHVVYQKLSGKGEPVTRIRELNVRKYGSHMISSRLNRPIWTVVDKVYGSIPMAILSPIAWPWPVMRRIKALADEIAPVGAIKGVVLGHSHRPGVKHFKGLTMINLGGWIKNTRACACVREGGHLKVIHIENRSHQLRWGRVLHQAHLSDSSVAI